MSRWSAAYSPIHSLLLPASGTELALGLRGGHEEKEEEESGGVARRSGPARLSACLFARVSNFNEEKSNHSSKGRSKCSSAHSAHSLIKKSTGMLLESWAHIQ